MPWSTGLGAAAKAKQRNKYRQVGNKRIKNLKKSRTGRIALDAALALKTLKKHEPPVTHTNFWQSGAATVDRALVVLPYALDRASNNSETQRECDNIYYYNCRGEFEIKPLSTNCACYYLRFIMGYSKGNPNAVSATALTPAEGAHSINLSTNLPTLEDKLDPDHYRVIVDREYTHSPSQIYNSDVIPDATSGITGHQNFTSKANWKPFIKKFNMKFNKKVMFDGQSGSDAVGEIPFVALLMYTDQHEPAYTGGADGSSHPSPNAKIIEKAYFKDC